MWHRSVASRLGFPFNFSLNHQLVFTLSLARSIPTTVPIMPATRSTITRARMNTFGTVGGMSYSNSTRTTAILATRELVRYSFLPYGPKGHLVRDFMHGQWIVSLPPNTSRLHMLTSSSLEQTISLRLSSSAVWIFLVSGALVVFD
jgi:hypothetical protein